MRVKQIESLWSLCCASFAMYKWMPIQREWEASSYIMRKRWMRYPILGSVFGAAYFIGNQLPVKFFSKFSHREIGIDDDNYKGRRDLVSRFRLFDNKKINSEEDRLLDHLSMYDKDPLSKPELLEHMVKRISENTDLTKIFKVKRLGKDENPIFWSFGKIHGLENIAFCDDKALQEAVGNPYKL